MTTCYWSLLRPNFRTLATNFSLRSIPPWLAMGELFNGGPFLPRNQIELQGVSDALCKPYSSLKHLPYVEPTSGGVIRQSADDEGVLEFPVTATDAAFKLQESWGRGSLVPAHLVPEARGIDLEGWHTGKDEYRSKRQMRLLRFILIHETC